MEMWVVFVRANSSYGPEFNVNKVSLEDRINPVRKRSRIEIRRILVRLRTLEMALHDPITAYIAENNLDAVLVQQFLESHGVEAFTSEDNSPVLGNLPALLKPRVWVNRSDATHVAQLLADYERGKVERDSERQVDEFKTISVKCQDCGNSSTFSGSLKGTVQFCLHCGSHVDVGAIDWPFDDVDEVDDHDDDRLWRVLSPFNWAPGRRASRRLPFFETFGFTPRSRGQVVITLLCLFAFSCVVALIMSAFVSWLVASH